MAQKLSGGCACGAIHYECNADPVVMLNCHCRDCQQASGSAYAAIVAVPKVAVQIRGEPRYHKIVGKAGKAVERGFCPSCGGAVAGCPWIAGWKPGRPIGLSACNGRLHLQRATMGSYGSHGPKACGRPALLICRRFLMAYVWRRGAANDRFWH